MRVTELGTSPHLTSVSRALRAPKMSPGPSVRDLRKSLQKCRGQSGKSPESLGKVSGKCLESVFGPPPDFLETFPGSWASGLGRHFRDFFGISGPEGPRDPCKRRAGSQSKGQSWKQCMCILVRARYPFHSLYILHAVCKSHLLAAWHCLYDLPCHLSGVCFSIHSTSTSTDEQ